MTEGLNLYFSTDFSSIEIILISMAWIMLLLALIPLTILSRPRRLQRKCENEIAMPEGGWPGISVIVYCREEATSLQHMLEKLFAQKYDGEYEIIIANDGKNEAAVDVVNRMKPRFENLHVTFVPDEAKSLSRRKMAFTLGIKAARHDIVLLTYADTLINSEQWIASVASLFVNGKDLVIGPAIPQKLYGRGLPRIMRRLDIELTTLTWISAALRGHAYRGEGHNLAFRKQLFFEHKGYARTLNLHYGDDDMFVAEIADKENTAVNIRRDGLVKIDWHSPKHMMRDESARRLYTTRNLGRGARAITTMLTWTSWGNVLSVSVLVAISWQNGYVFIASVIALLVYWIIVSLRLSRAGRFLRLRMPMLWLVPSLMLRPLMSCRRYLRMLRNRSTNYTWQKTK